MAALAGYYQILSHIILTSGTSGWQKSIESSGYGMVVQESRNDSYIIVTTFGYIEHLINIESSNNSDKNRYQASEEFILPLPYKQSVVLPPKRKYTCLREHDVTHSHSIHNLKDSLFTILN